MASITRNTDKCETTAKGQIKSLGQTNYLVWE